MAAVTAPVLAPHRFRRRLTVVFVSVAAGASGLVALVSIVLMESYREQEFLEQAQDTMETSLVLAPKDLVLEDLPPLLGAFREQGSFETLAVVDGAVVSSSSELDPSALPPAAIDSGTDGWTGEVAGERYLVLNPDRGDPRTQLYFFFPREPLETSLSNDRQLLLLVWLGVAVVAALAGAIVARRTLAPVTHAAAAARSLSEGLLDTRLSADRKDEFGMWAESFNEMAAALEEKIDDLAAARDRERQLTANVAHDLRTPVSALAAEAELLQAHADALPPPARRLAALLLADVTRLVSLVEGLLELAALDGGRAEAVIDHVDLDELVREVVALAAPRGAVELEAGQVSLETDGRRVRRIVLNLVTNAVRHGGGAARVTLRADAEAVRLEVADRGPGIDPETLPLIFGRFYRADAARSGEGSGLGLAIAREDALLLGGELSVTSVPGEGAVFALCLPCTPPGTASKGDGRGFGRHASVTRPRP